MGIKPFFVRCIKNVIMKLSIFWFRRDLRLEDNTALYHSLKSGNPVLPIFIFDDNILSELSSVDARVSFIYEKLKSINENLRAYGSSMLCLKGDPIAIWKRLIGEYDISDVFINKDYEPYAINRDTDVKELLEKSNIRFHEFKDQVIFEENEVVKKDGKPYTVFTPYKNRWLGLVKDSDVEVLDYSGLSNYYKSDFKFPDLSDMGFAESVEHVRDYDLANLRDYKQKRDFPSEDITSYLSPHLRFGTVSIRKIISMLGNEDGVFLSELIWREFFMQILFHYPEVVNSNFKRKFDFIKWRNNEEEFKRWCEGRTGYPLVDAGMRELNETGYMHNRVRMVVASFLCKHLLIDWRWGEAYFAGKLLDYDLSANNGNWQWAASTGCDAVPYFRIFNPLEQQKKFDKDFKYIKKWIPDFDKDNYIAPIVDHKFARERALNSYKKSINTIL